MVQQVVSFVADKPAPAAQPASSGPELALSLFKWTLGAMLLPSAGYVALTEIGFLAGPSELMGWPGAVIVGIASTVGLVVLLVTAGITWDALRPVSIASVVLFALCALLALESAGGFAYVASHPLPAHEKPDPRFDAEPRHPATVERAIMEWRSLEREYRGKNGWIVVTDGAEILARTNGCTAFHYAWEHSQCEEFLYLQAERKKSAKVYGETTSEELTGMAAIFSPGALSFGRHYASWHIHLAAVLFAALCLPILFGVSYALTMGPVPVAPAAAAAPVVKSPTEHAFEAFCEEYVTKDSSTVTPSPLLYLAYRLKCAKETWPQYPDDAAFGRKMRAWALARHKSVEIDSGKGRMVYTGIGLKDDDLTRQARQALESGAS
jgi:hypothetical protein